MQLPLCSLFQTFFHFFSLGFLLFRKIKTKMGGKWDYHKKDIKSPPKVKLCTPHRRRQRGFPLMKCHL